MNSARTLLFVVLFLFYAHQPGYAQVAINQDGSPPNPSAVLDVNFTDRGLLPPRVALTAQNEAAPVTSPISGLLVYNTATAGSEPYQITPGYYYWKGNGWYPLSLPAGVSTGDLLYWNGTSWTNLPAGLPGQNLQMAHTHIPTWTGATYPTVTTNPSVTNITTNSATSGGEVTADGGSSVYQRGVCYDTLPNPAFTGNHTSDGSGIGIFTSNLTGLSSGKTYHVRAYSTSNIGTSYGADVTFNTTVYIAPPTVQTTSISNVTTTTAASGGNVTDSGGAAVTARGICWSTSQNPTIANSHTSDGTGTGTFVSNITGLTPGTTYYIRAYATNSGGISYGGQLSFQTAPNPGGTSCPGMPTVTWLGNTYNTVQIGSQCWLKSNINSGTRINGTVEQTNNSILEKYCYNNSETNCSVYGGLYQWGEAVQYLNGASNTTSWNPVPTGFVIGVCPTGWHVPTLNDWNALVAFLGGATVAGGKMKETGLVHWASPNAGATNESGFTGLPGGQRELNGTFTLLTFDGFFWSSTEAGPNAAYYLKLDYNTASAAISTDNKAKGFSVRCLRNN